MKLIHIIIILTCIIVLAFMISLLVTKFAPKQKRKKILVGIFASVLSLVVIAVGGTCAVITYVPTCLDKQHKSGAEYYTAETPFGKALVVYQPAWTDVTKDSAEAIAQSLCDRGYDVTVNFPGKFLPEDVSEYDIIVAGTPVYNSKGSALVIDYLKSLQSLNGKKVIFFTTGSSTPIEKDTVYDDIGDHYKGASIIYRIKFAKKSDKVNMADELVDKLCRY